MPRRSRPYSDPIQTGSGFLMGAELTRRERLELDNDALCVDNA
jgi:hypothetical protein